MNIIRLVAKFVIALSTVLMVALFAFAQQTQEMPSQSTPPQVTHHMSNGEKQKTSAGKGYLVDVNTASKEELAALPGSNPDLAQNIISGRPYAKKTDLVRKKVVPKGAYDQMQGQIIAKKTQNMK
ncbi:MAG TPA: helix-hairpin-helix domain-containing protein [Terriglobales bacterium]|nr:helix-hairpin-helix domain-containing protein [Terriglobales bacterium]